MIPQETDPDLPVSVQASPGEAWVRVGGIECSSACMGSFEGGILYTIIHSPAHQQKIRLKSMAQSIRARPSFPLSQSLSLEGRQNEIHNHRKLIKLITWTTALSNSMK